MNICSLTWILKNIILHHNGYTILGLIRIELSLINIDIGKSYETILYCDSTDAVLDLLRIEHYLININIWISHYLISSAFWGMSIGSWANKCKLRKFHEKIFGQIKSTLLFKEENLGVEYIVSPKLYCCWNWQKKTFEMAY